MIKKVRNKYISLSTMKSICTKLEQVKLFFNLSFLLFYTDFRMLIFIFNIESCNSTGTNYDYVKLFESFLNERHVIRFVSPYYSLEADTRIIDNIRINPSDDSLINVHQYTKDLKKSTYNNFEEYHDILIFSYSKMNNIWENKELNKSIYLDFMVIVTVSYLPQNNSEQFDIILYLKIENIHKLFNNTYGSYQEEKDYFNLTYKIGSVYFLTFSFIQNFFKSYHSMEIFKKTPKYKCDKNGNKICRDPRNINFDTCNQCNNLIEKNNLQFLRSNI
ncbi:hypothetical protein HZS_1015 [Henneguya salminicola]|nr:hypothetical protein HZS_1015 [Henneguya salminicola]